MFSRPVVPRGSRRRLQQRGDAPPRPYLPEVGKSDFREYLEERALAATVTADDADDFPLFHCEGNIAQGPEDLRRSLPKRRPQQRAS